MVLIAAKGRHRETDEGPNWGIRIVWLVCGSILLFAVFIMLAGPLNLYTADVTPPPLPSAHEGHATAPTQKPAAKPLAARAMDVAGVLKDTQFVQRYKREQPGVAKGHSDENLASHGVALCAYIADDRVSVTDMVYTYMNDWHHHPGYKDGPQQANHTISLALQEICPALVPKWKAKRPL